MGTGLVVSTSGEVVTCVHVVTAAGVSARTVTEERIGVYFPQALAPREKSRLAVVTCCFHEYEDDVVLLQLIGGPPPLGPEQIAVLGTAEESEDHSFISYGYRSLNQYTAGRAEGIILGTVEAPVDKAVQAEPVQIRSSEINRGMSGAAVLDKERNLVIGIISESWFPDDSGKDRDTAWAVDCRVLSLSPFDLPMLEKPHPMNRATQPGRDSGETYELVVPEPGIHLENAPPVPSEWIGRSELLHEITCDWLKHNHRVTGLIGPAGVGKSSLARRWIDHLTLDPSLRQPKGVFWWTFCGSQSVDEFFEAALLYMGGGSIDPRKYPSTFARARIVSGMLSAGEYIFVLDGLEVIQNADGDRYGLLTSLELSEFIHSFAGTWHDSFCVITSRLPVFDLMEFTTFAHRNVRSLSAKEILALLRTMGITGAERNLRKIISDWDGHTLTMSLLGSYLAYASGGDIASVSRNHNPAQDAQGYEHVNEVLNRYDSDLPDAEKAFLAVFSAFRISVRDDAFPSVFRTDCGPDAVNAPVAHLENSSFSNLVDQLVNMQLIVPLTAESHYGMHPLIREHYLELLDKKEQAPVMRLHHHIASYYLEIGGELPESPTVRDLQPFVEAVHHTCMTGNYDEADRIRWEYIDQGDRHVLVSNLAANETQLSLLLEFFEGYDTSKEPMVSNPVIKGSILNDLGICLMSLGRLNEAKPFYERSLALFRSVGELRDISTATNNLSLLHMQLGELDASRDTAMKAAEIAQQLGNKQREVVACATQAWTAHLFGDLEEANHLFENAEVIQSEFDPRPYLYSLRGTQHADHLLKIGDIDNSRRIAEMNLTVCEAHNWPVDISRCYRALGDLEAENEEEDRDFSYYYDKAVEIARSLSQKDVLIEALIARGRSALEISDLNAAISDLAEALDHALSGGYRLYEADIRLGLARAYLASGDITFARQEAERARVMSEQMRYHWGEMDANKIITELDCGVDE